MEQSKLFELSQDIAEQCKWDGYDICDVFLEALTNANFHSLRKELEATINNYKNK
jgi:hypothetical protein